MAMAIGKLPDDEASTGGDDGGESIFAEINITPLTDVFLVLLIILMISALAVQVEARREKRRVRQEQEQAEIEKKSGLKVNLPAGAAQEIDMSKQSLVLIIPLSGDISVGGKIMRDDQIDKVFQAAFQRDKATQVVLKADRGVAHGRVVNIMERAKQAGLIHLAIGTSGGS
ncbi:MAG: biopolymer transporter ExbD [Deltaproteobacteria bacterium]|nr:MAG: biopolymer transporter ExbD [Deltaproteobacteria bacterium]